MFWSFDPPFPWLKNLPGRLRRRSSKTGWRRSNLMYVDEWIQRWEEWDGWILGVRWRFQGLCSMVFLKISKPLCFGWFQAVFVVQAWDDDPNSLPLSLCIYTYNYIESIHIKYAYIYIIDIVCMCIYIILLYIYIIDIVCMCIYIILLYIYIITWYCIILSIHMYIYIIVRPKKIEHSFTIL